MSVVVGVLSFLVLFTGCRGRIPDGSRRLHLHPSYYQPVGFEIVSRGTPSPENPGNTTEPSLENFENLQSSSKERKRRDTTPSNPEIKTTVLKNDSHNLAYITWTSNVSDTIILMTRDVTTGPNSFSNLYVSHDYGMTFVLSNDKIPNGGGGKKIAIDDLYQSQANKTWYIFVDERDKKVITTKDDGVSFQTQTVTWNPYYLLPHPTNPSYVLGYDNKAKTLYLTKNFCVKWDLVAKSVAPSFSWGEPGIDSENFVVFQQYQLSGSTKSQVMVSHNLFATSPKSNLTGIDEFRLVGEYMFAVKNPSQTGQSSTFLVSFSRGPFKQALLPTDENGQTRLEREYYIADASEGQVFLAVNHASNSTNLYISEVKGHKFSLSLERALYHNGQSDTSPTWYRRYVPFRLLDFERIAALRGVYVATQLEYGTVGHRPLRTVITFDKGGEWSYVSPPSLDANNMPVSCFLPDCSLHLSQQWSHFNPYSRAELILSSKQAPGLIVATGMLGHTLTFSYDIYLSNDGGVTWQQSLAGEYYYNMGDHGGVIVAIDKQHATNHLMFTVDEGLTWQRKNFSSYNVQVYGIVVEPGERSTVFSVYGDYIGKREWVVVRVDLTGELGSNCTKTDYVTWHPSDERTEVNQCILGRDYAYERRRRTTPCFNGEDYDRKVSYTNCSCSREDFECDFGFEMDDIDSPCLSANGQDQSFVSPQICPPGGSYQVTRGYRKVSGDTCLGGDELFYSPFTVPCPHSVSIVTTLKNLGSTFFGAQNAAVSFTAHFGKALNSSSTIFHWDFGDGKISAGQGSQFVTVQHSYSSLGSYIVHVSVFSSSPTQYAFIQVSIEAALGQLSVAIIAIPDSPSVAQNTPFLAKLSDHTFDISGMTYTWNFQNPQGVANSFTRQQGFLNYTFTDSGSWTVSVSVTNGIGTVSTQRQFNVKDFVPQQVTAVAKLANEINLHWSQPPDGSVTGYSIQSRHLDGNSGSYSSWQYLAMSVPPGEFTYLAVQLTPNTKYEFQIRAYTEEGAGPWCPSVSATTKTAASSAPQNVAVKVNQKKHSMVLSWQQPLHINGKIVYYTIQMYTSLGNYTTTKSIGLTYTFTNLLPDTIYYFAVVAVTDPAIPSVRSAFTTNALLFTPPPSPFDVQVYVYNGSAVGFKWSMPPKPLREEAPLGYTVSLYKTNQLAKSVNVTGTFYEFSDLMPNTLYQFKVAAYNSAGSGKPTALVSAATKETALDAPQRFRVVTVNSTAVKLSFDPPQKLNGIPSQYAITKYDADGSTKVYKRPLEPNNDFVVGGLKPYTVYTFSVLLINDQGTPGTPTPNISNRTDEAVPSAPVDIRASPITLSSIKVQWSAPRSLNGKIIQYKVQVEPEKGNVTQKREIILVGGDKLQCIASGLTPSMMYDVWVAASTSKGFSRFSDPIETSAKEAPIGTWEVEAAFQTGVDADLLLSKFGPLFTATLVNLTRASSNRFRGVSVDGSTVVFYLLPPDGSGMSNDDIVAQLTKSAKAGTFTIPIGQKSLQVQSVTSQNVPSSELHSPPKSYTAVIVGCALAIVVIALFIGLVVMGVKHRSTKHHYSVLSTTGSLSFRNENIDGGGEDDLGLQPADGERRSRKGKRKGKKPKKDNDEDDDPLLVA
eukprot:m.2788 g.2788  ORF g.2788 m.2788 type:complete len:1622 (+) comp8904_c0_seq1:25-4890(+)